MKTNVIYKENSSQEAKFRPYFSRLPTNCNLYAYGANNPVHYIDPDGRQSIYLPGGGTSFNGPCPGLKYNMEEYSKNNDALSGLVEGLNNNSNNFAIFIDKVFLDKKFENEANKFYGKMILEFEKLKNDSKASGEFDLNKDGVYDEKETKLFSQYVNDSMILNYSDQKDLGPYKVEIPQITDDDAKEYLNNKFKPSMENTSLKSNDLL